MNDSMYVAAFLIPVVLLLAVFSLRECGMAVCRTLQRRIQWQHLSFEELRPDIYRLDSNETGVTWRSVFVGAVAAFATVEVLRTHGVLPLWWEWWFSPVFVVVVIGIPVIGLYIGMPWLNHHRIWGRLLGYCAFLAILLVCGLVAWLLRL